MLPDNSFPNFSDLPSLPQREADEKINASDSSFDDLPENPLRTNTLQNQAAKTVQVSQETFNEETTLPDMPLRTTDFDENFPKTVHLNPPLPSYSSGFSENQVTQLVNHAKNQYQEVKELKGKGENKEVKEKKAKAENLSASEALKSANSFVEKNKNSLINDPSLATEAYELYAKAANLFMKEGNVQAAFQTRALCAENVPLSQDHPIVQTLTSPEIETKESRSFVTHYSNLDSSIIKGQSIEFYKRMIDGEPKQYFQFNVSDSARDKLDETIELIKANDKVFKQNLPSALKDCEVQFSTIDYQFHGKNKNGEFSSKSNYTLPNAKVIEINFKGIGRVLIGQKKPFENRQIVFTFPDQTKLPVNSYMTLQNEITIELDPSVEKDDAPKILHAMASVLDIGAVMGTSREDDQIRLKIGLILKTFCPKELCALIKNSDFLLPIPELLKIIYERIPEAKALLKKYLEDQPELIQKQEITPGNQIFVITDLSEQIKKMGGVGLMTNVGLNKNIQQTSETVSLILRSGPLSTLSRYKKGLHIPGASSTIDLGFGGGGQVYTRLVTENHVNVTPIQNFALIGKATFLFRLKVMERGAYGYPTDCYGTKLENYYSNREGLLDLTKTVNNNVKKNASNPNWSESNEIMTPKVGRDDIVGIVVKNKLDFDVLVAKLEQEQQIVLKEDGIKYVIIPLDNGIGHREIPVDKFIHCSENFQAEMWDT